MAEPVNVDLALWGKSRGLSSPYPLICHLLDAAAAVETLWDVYLPSGLKATLAAQLSSSEAEARHLLAYWAALHDLGKCASCFQDLDERRRPDLQAYPRPDAGYQSHAFMGQVWLGKALARQGYRAARSHSPAARVAQIVGGHHGRFTPFNQLEFHSPLLAVPALSDGSWEEQRQAILSALHELLGAPSPPKQVSAAGAAMSCAAIILADWLVSQEPFLAERLRAGLPESGERDRLRRHLHASRAVTPRLLRDAGLGRLTFKPGGFAEDFPFPPNELQRSIAECLPDLLDGDPGLLLIMAPMGEGKTEAALHAAKLMGEAAGMPGFFFGLPTMATTDQMFTRADEFRQRRTEGSDSLTLLHGMAWLNAAYAPGGDPVDVLSADPTATEWLRGSKRGLLANLAVGTIDQALLAVLRGRHNVVRMLGLTGKVMIIDEAHAYDSYMQGLLKMLLQWLGALRVPVVLMSATLPVMVGRRLAAAYLAGTGCPEQAVPDAVYPGWIYVSPQQSTPVGVSSRQRTLVVETRSVPLGAGRRPERGDVLREILSPLFQGEGCAAVICNTVAEAQLTYLQLHRWAGEAGENAPVVSLLHSRFPLHARERITREAIARFGKAARGGRRAAILVATQVIEQSLDLDFDIVISDLAPIALLLQRAGRCHRHQDNDARRPAWAQTMRLVVLTPSGRPGELVIPPGWPYVYPKALLRRTHKVLNRLEDGRVAIPDDVQRLVDEVYDESFGDESNPLTDDDIDRLADEQTKDLYAQMAAIPGPEQVKDLSELSRGEVVDEYATRLGADGGKVVCCQASPEGQLMLGGEPLPRPSGPKGRFTREQVKLILRHTVPVPASWIRGAAPGETPPGWADNPHLKDLIVIRMTGEEPSGVLGDRQLWLSPEMGLSQYPPR
ncbi:CRISPR-associated helicase Cas3' [Nonomuraea sp. NPDC059194]|uniref:CRISPR-associated helicase Cas3' n=1 Tax=Nonomuraea sp. NPDC059194 TaxID=3346764 RepID=UPI0036A9E3DC